MVDTPAASFYTGLVAELYRPLRSTSFDPQRYRDLIATHGEPALELGCGDGDPLLDLRESGLDVDGIDSSADMIARLHQRARDRNLDVTAWVASMETIAAPREYATVFLAGPTLNLLPTDEAMLQALRSMKRALAPGGTAVVPLFVPETASATDVGSGTRDETSNGWISCRTLEVKRDESNRTQTSTLLYEREHHGTLEQLERQWVLHWVGVEAFSAMAEQAGFRITDAPPAIDHQARDFTLQA